MSPLAASPPLPSVDAAHESTGLVLYRASRLEALVDPFRELLAATWPADPLARQTVIAAHPGIRHWLNGALARRMGEGGIVANLDVVLPSTWLDRLARERLQEQAVALPHWQRVHLRWNLHQWLAEPGVVPGLDDPRIARFLHPDGADEAERARRRFQLADRLAMLYSQYLVYRGDWLRAWQRGDARPVSAGLADEALRSSETRLLAPLWRKAARELGKHRAEVIDALIDDLHADARARPPLHVFGVSHLAPRELDALRAYARQALVALYLPDPCRDYWGVLDDGDVASWRAQEDVLIEQAGEGEWWRPQRHELLSRWGRLGQQFFAALVDGEVRGEVRHWRDREDHAPQDRLQRVQESIRRLDEGLLTPPGDVAGEMRDASLRVHACHTPKRELEVLRDAMHAALAEGIEPGQMLVMAPDIRRYLPLIPSLFGEPGDPRALLPYHLADVPRARTHSLFVAFARLLELPGMRLSAPEVLDLVALPEVARALGLDADALDAFERLLRDSRVAWSLDAAHRAGFGVPAIGEHGFAWALDRIAAGYLLAEDADAGMQAVELPDGVELLPLAGVENAGAVALGALDALLALFADLQVLSRRSLPASRWSDELVALCERALKVQPGDEVARDAWGRLLQTVRGLAEETTVAGVDPKLHWAVVRERMLEALQAVPERQPFLLGGATFCGMVPQRAIPFRFIAVLGLDEGEFPRTSQDAGLDLMARLRRQGDRDQRSDDRYLFLETVMSARERLHLSWLGQGVTDGKPRNAAAPLAELMDLLARADDVADRKAERDADATDSLGKACTWRVLHPLQPFDARYFDGGDVRLYSYDKAQAAMRELPAGQTPPAVAAPDAGWPQRIELDALREYWRDPARNLLQRRLGVDLDVLQDSTLPDSEPLGQVLPAYRSIARELFQQQFAQGLAEPGQAMPDWLRLSGRLPSGSMREHAWRHEAGVLEKLYQAAQREQVQPGPPQPQAIELDFGIDGHPLQLTGVLRDVHALADGGLCVVSLPIGNAGLRADKDLGVRHRLPAYVGWLALRLATPIAQPVRLALLCDARSDGFARKLNDWDERLRSGEDDLAGVQQRLRQLLRWYLEAPHHPLRWFPACADAVMKKVDCNADHEAIRDAVRSTWMASGPGLVGERDRGPGHVALLAGGEDFADDARVDELIAFTFEVAACMVPARGPVAAGSTP
ncbi:exodeoxyribonuclease V subunit gamma [Luteimonas sp. e5]